MSGYWAICKCGTGRSILPVDTIFLLDFKTVHVPTVFLFSFDHNMFTGLYPYSSVLWRLPRGGEYTYSSGARKITLGFWFCSFLYLFTAIIPHPFLPFLGHTFTFLYWFTIFHHILASSIFLSQPNSNFQKIIPQNARFPTNLTQTPHLKQNLDLLCPQSANISTSSDINP